MMNLFDDFDLDIQKVSTERKNEVVREAATVECSQHYDCGSTHVSECWCR